MVSTSDKNIDSVQTLMDAYQALSTDEKLGLLWVVYKNMGGGITPAAPGAAEIQFTQTLVSDVKAMKSQDQLDFMRDLVERRSTDYTQRYGAYTNDNKLVFWYELAELMRMGDVIPVPESYELSANATRIFNDMVLMEFNEQITLLRHAVVSMGTDA